MRAVRPIGYVTTAIVLAPMIVLAGWWAYQNYWSPRATRFREISRTHERPLSAALFEADAAKALHPVRVPSGGGSTLSFVLMPSFSPGYAVNMRLGPGERDAHGAIIGVGRDAGPEDLTYSQAQTFTMPKAEYRELALRLGSLTDGWAGSPDGPCFDGTPVAFELIRNGYATSGVGNADCDHHYAAVRRLIEPTIFRFAPKPGAPRNAAAQTRAGVCWRHGLSCHHDAVLVEPSTDPDLNEAALNIFSERRTPEPCGGDDGQVWHGTYVYKPGGAVEAVRPSCRSLPSWPDRVRGAAAPARWNVPPALHKAG